MSGEDIKKILRAEGISMASLAEKLGFTDQRLNSALKSDNVKSGLIEAIAEVLNKPIEFFYNETKESNVFNGGVAVAGDNNSIVTISERFISLLETKDEQMNRLISLLEKS